MATRIRQMTYDPTFERIKSPQIDLGIAVALGVLAALGATDLVLDRKEAGWGFHFAVELAFLVLLLLSAGVLLGRWTSARRERDLVSLALQRKQSEMTEWRDTAQVFLEGLGDQIERQFVRWEFTDAESAVALLLLKGYSHAEIAGIFSKSERTVRQQAVAVYRKSDLAGRAQLAAYFLEDLLLPSQRKGEPGAGSLPPHLTRAAPPSNPRS